MLAVTQNSIQQWQSLDSLACAVTTAFDIKLKRALFSFRIRKTLILTITSVVA